ncbi:hypothetical protein PENDEC_c025G04651 [Penicillium decumbens]|uniref:Uncharacterized protein n=1 Tax=Penicillium decumbens TaxID=69771 RepID=A0A1V6NZZ3_PENDC|nr:hypothetical protein PENDEC_c025G04651 [Penicillium decumbens]
MSHPVDPTQPDKWYSTGPESDFQEISLHSDDDLDLEQEDPMAAQPADTVKQIGRTRRPRGPVQYSAPGGL